MLLRVVANLCAVVPGLGHVVLGRCGRGVMLFFFFATLLNGYLLAPYLFPPEEVAGRARLLLGASGLVWAYAVTEVFLITVWRRRPAFVRRKRQLYYEAHRAYLGDRLTDARRILNRLLRMDPEEPAGHFFLALVHRDLGNVWRARLRFREALWVDPDHRWRAQVRRELADLRSGRVTRG